MNIARKNWMEHVRTESRPWEETDNAFMAVVCQAMDAVSRDGTSDSE
jgi:gluconate kinase